jgi:hypothetical protein
VMAQTQFSEKAPAIQGEGQANRVTLSGRSQVFVTVTLAAAGEYVFFSTINMPIAVFTLAGTQIDETSLNMSIQECQQVKYRIAFNLPAASYVVRLGGPPVNMGMVPTTVDLVVGKQN